MKIYDLVLSLLIQSTELRNDDRRLIWNVWFRQNLVSADDDNNSFITKESFMKAANPESIRRCRQKIQEDNEFLRATAPVEKARRAKAQEKGTHIYREEVYERS